MAPLGTKYENTDCGEAAGQRLAQICEADEAARADRRIADWVRNHTPVPATV